MKLALLTAAYVAVLVGSWELQKTELLLGYTLGVVGVLGITFVAVDYLARRMY